MNEEYMKGRVEGLIASSVMVGTLAHEIEEHESDITVADILKRVRWVESTLQLKAEELDANLTY